MKQALPFLSSLPPFDWNAQSRRPIQHKWLFDEKILDEAAAAHAAYQTTMTVIAKRTAAMEITLRKNTLHNTALEMYNLIGVAHIVVHGVKQEIRCK